MERNFTEEQINVEGHIFLSLNNTPNFTQKIKVSSHPEMYIKINSDMYSLKKLKDTTNFLLQ